jgi:hypothetical protein
MSDRPNVVIAGDKVFAGIDEDDCSEVSFAMVIQFQSKEQFVKAMKDRSVEFEWFGETEIHE